MILQLCKDLFKSYDYVVFTNNFFSSVKLFKALKKEEIDACDTAKSSSEYSNQLLRLRLIFIKAKNWGLRAHMIVKDEVLCLVWQNNNVLQYMIISHDLSDLDELHLLDHWKRWNISSEFTILRFSNNLTVTSYLSFIVAHSTLYYDWSDLMLSISLVTKKYNDNMKDSNENDQQRFYYSLHRRNNKYFWRLFEFLLEAAVLNSFKLHKLRDLIFKLKHKDFVLQLALKLTQNFYDNDHLQESKISIATLNMIYSSEHHYIKLAKKTYCTLCSKLKRKNYTMKRKTLAEISDVNVNWLRKKQRQRDAETSWGCAAAECFKLVCCRWSKCWTAIHSTLD